MTKPVFDAETWIDAVAPALGLTIEPEWRADVIFHLGLISRAAALVSDASPEARECEPGPIFTPGQS